MPIFGIPAIFERGYRDVHDEPKAALGACYVSNEDEVEISYVRFSEDVKEGDCVQIKYDHYEKANLSPQSSGGSIYAPAGSQKITEHDATYETSLAGFPKEPTLRDYALIRVIGGTGRGQMGYITNYTNKVLNIHWYDKNDGTLKTALDGTSDYTIWAPWYVKKAVSNHASTPVRGSVNGVVLARSAKKDEYGFIGVKGDFPIRLAAAGSAVDPGDYVIPTDVSADAGGARQALVGRPVRPFASVHTDGSNMDVGLIMASVFAERISIVRQVAENQIRGFDRPKAA